MHIHVYCSALVLLHVCIWLFTFAFTAETSDVDKFSLCFCLFSFGSELLQVVLTQRSSCGMPTQQVSSYTDEWACLIRHLGGFL